MMTQPLGGVATSPEIPGGPIVAAGHIAPPHVQAKAVAPTPQSVARAVGEANKTLKSIASSVQFEVDPETKMTVIKIVDTDTHTVLRQVPAQEMIEIAHALDHMQGLLLRQKA